MVPSNLIFHIFGEKCMDFKYNGKIGGDVSSKRYNISERERERERETERDVFIVYPVRGWIFLISLSTQS